MNRDFFIGLPSSTKSCQKNPVLAVYREGKLTDRLREKMLMKEDVGYTADFDDSTRRSNHSAVQVWFQDGSCTPKVDIAYPLGHHRRREEAAQALRAKFAGSLRTRFPRKQQEDILHLCDDVVKMDRTPVHDFVGMFASA